jgi:GTPase
MSGFVDEAQLHAKAGDGGAGAVSFRREAHVDRGGPDGGDGGHGGDVWLVADPNQASLLGFRDHPFRRAGDGTHGSGKRRHGQRGADLVVAVPVGTVVRSRDGAALCDLAHPGERWLAGRGGTGGRGNARFLSNTRRAPGFAEQGERGEERWLNLELKLVADVALVGFPNAGKSTLISAVSAARPKIAPYPFTTLEPHLGVLRLGRPGDEVEVVMADVPGLVEGAAEGRGLGHRFLRHVERARVLLVLLDLASAEGISPADQERVLLGELERYRPELLERPRLVVGSKADLAHDAQPGTGVPAPVPALRISAVTGEGVPDLLGRVVALVVEARRAAAGNDGPPGGEIVVHRPAAEGVSVERSGSHAWVVRGRAAERAVNLSDLTDDGAMAEAVRRLRRMGVDRALTRAGARDGDEVTVGHASFLWFRDEAPERVETPRRRPKDDGTAKAGEQARRRRTSRP